MSAWYRARDGVLDLTRRDPRMRRGAVIKITTFGVERAFVVTSVRTLKSGAVRVRVTEQEGAS